MASPARTKLAPPSRLAHNAAAWETHWPIVRDGCLRIYEGRTNSLSFEELYRNAYNLCMNKMSRQLYDEVKQLLQAHVIREASSLAELPDDTLLQRVVQVWDHHKLSVTWIANVLMYLDNKHSVPCKLPTVQELGVIVFRDGIFFAESDLKARIIKSVLTQVKAERDGAVIDRHLLRRVVDIIVGLSGETKRLYEAELESPLLDATADYYTAESEAAMAENDTTAYLRRAERRLNEEDMRVSHYLDESTRPKLTRLVETTLLERHVEKLVHAEHSGLVALIREERFDDIARMYQLLGRVASGHKEMRAALSSTIAAAGAEINRDPALAGDAVRWVQAVIDLRDVYDAVLLKSFAKDRAMTNCVNDACRKFIAAQSRAAEFLSLFMDDRLRRGGKESNEQELSDVLDKALSIFRLLEDKDVFERYYKTHLAKRLLLRRSGSDEAERSVLAKLKVECGHQFTSKLEGMFTDIRLSEELASSFAEYVRSSEKSLGSVDLSVTVLTTTYWPLPSAPRAILPSQVLPACAVFEEFYSKKLHVGRKLSWQTSLGQAEVRARFGPGGAQVHELQVATPAMLVLLLFNDRDRLSFEQIATETALPVPELKRTLQSLACGKFRVINKEPRGRDVEQNDEFVFNDRFSAPLRRIKLQQIVNRVETESENKETKERVEENRSFQIEAAIVRIMKARKELDHAQLVQEVISMLQSQFTPNPVQIKRRIESLIDREYLSRAENMRTYVYIA